MYNFNMKIKILIFSIFVILCGVFGSTLIVEAQLTPTSSEKNTQYQLLAPLPDGEGSLQENFDAGDDSALGKYISLIIKLVIGISAVLAVVMIVMGGIEYMGSELISSKEAGKERIQNAILGLLIAMSAYALLNTINPDLFKSDIKIDTARLAIDLNDRVPQTAAGGKYKNGVLPGTPVTGTPTPLPAGVSINAAQCTKVGQSNCTSTIGLNMSQVIAIQNGCKCSLTITGGTEWWLHGGQSGSTSHQNGSTTVDLRRTTELDNYLSAGKPLVKMRRYQSPVGSVLFEGDHWHIGS